MKVSVNKETIREVKKHADSLSNTNAVNFHKSINHLLYAVNSLVKQAGLDNTADYVWPMVGRISAPYGERRINSKGVPYYHTGIDLADNPKNATPIKSIDNGIVLYAGWYKGYGYTLDIMHNHNIVSRYAHCSKLLLKKNDAVKQGQQIAVVGSTGHSTGPHLHFEILKEGKTVDPMKYLPKRT